MADSHSDPLKSDHSELRLSSSAARDSSTISGGGLSSGKYKLMSPAKLPISRSPCISLPPGLSPTSFLESPVLLSNMKAEPSPTTGSFMNPQLWHSASSGHSLAAYSSRKDTVDETRNDYFEFKPHALTDSVSGLPHVAPMKSPDTNNRNSETSGQVQTQFHSQPFASTNSTKNGMTSGANDSSHSLAIVPSGIDSEEIYQGIASTTGLQGSQPDHKDIGNSVTADRSSDDGYNWRKYGQKIVKGSEFPRSYYKCTHPNCEVKKIFERSYEGKITEIVYKGTHDHPKPQPARRFSAGAIMSIQEQTDHVSSLASGEDKSNMYGLNSPNNDPSGTPQLSPRGTNDNYLDGTAQLNGINDEGNEDEFSKRRKLDEMCIDVTPVVKPIREPRVVVQTVSEVDILDDGYRWRKYGQKVVRGNPNPRSYYKCTNVGCPVRKHVERASHDPKAVITTYEGKHNHDVPAARNSSHEMAGPSNSPPSSRVRMNGNASVSLDLGVGINSVSENRSNERQQVDPGSMQFQANRARSIFNVVQMSPMSSFYGVVNGGSYVTRDNHLVNHNFQNPTGNHSSNQYPQNFEGVVRLGP